jgi:hypothetical protein
VLAVAIAFASAHTELGSQRIRAVLGAMEGVPATSDKQLSDQMAVWSNGFDRQMRRLTEIIRTSNEEREGLAAKVGAIERRLNELGTAMAQNAAQLETDAKAARQSAAAASAAAASAVRLTQARPEAPQSVSQATFAGVVPAAPIAPALPAAMPAGPSTAQAPPHVPAAPETVQSGPSANAPSPGQVRLHLGATPVPAMPPGLPQLAGAPPVPAYTGTIPMPAAGQDMTPATMHAFMPQPWPSTIAAAAEPRAASAPIPPPNPDSAAPKEREAALAAPVFQSNPLMSTGILDAPPVPGAIATEFGVDLGAAATIELARSRWNELLVHQSPLLDNLKPLIALKDGGRSGQELHLVAGPLTSTAASARLCAVMSATGASCQPSVYEGQRLAAR